MHSGPLSWASRVAGSWDLVEASAGPAEGGFCLGAPGGCPGARSDLGGGCHCGPGNAPLPLGFCDAQQAGSLRSSASSSGPRGPRPGWSLLRTPGLPVTPSLPFSLGSCTRFQAGQKMPVSPTFRLPRNSDRDLLDTHSPPRVWEEETAKEHAQPLHWSSFPFRTVQDPGHLLAESLYPPWKQLCLHYF